MPIEPSEENCWVPGPRGNLGEDPQDPAFQEWLEFKLPELLASAQHRLSPQEVRELLARMNEDHPGVDVEVVFGGTSSSSVAGEFLGDTMTIRLAGAVEDIEHAMAHGSSTVVGEKLESYEPTLVVALFAQALSLATYGSGGAVEVERHGPEYVGAFAYVCGRYLGEEGSPSLGEALSELAGMMGAPPDHLDPAVLERAVALGIRSTSLESELVESLLNEGLRVRAFSLDEWLIEPPN